MPARGWPEGHRGEGAVEVGLVECGGVQARCHRIGVQPAEGQFIGYGQQRDRVRRGVPTGEDVRVRDGERECRMDCLTSLGARWQIGAGDQVQAGDRALTVRHVTSVRAGVNPFHHRRPPVQR